MAWLRLAAFSAILLGAFPAVSEPVASPPRSATRALRHEKLVTALQEQDWDVVMLGDSLTAHWPKDLRASLFPGRKVLDYGVAGDTAENLLWRLRNSPLTVVHPSIATLMIGTNNIHHGSGRRSLPSVEAIIATIRSAWPSARLLIFDPPPSRSVHAAEWEPERQAYNAALKGLAAKYGAKTISLDPALGCVSAPNCNLFLPDGTHFSRKGYEEVVSYLKQSAHP